MPQVSLRVLKFFFTLWFTVSCVFLVSRLLPSVNNPRGLADADSTVYGTSNQNTLQKITSDYLTRTGYNRPLFYFSFQLKGLETAENIKPMAEATRWLSAAVLRHGVVPSQAFYKEWQNWKKTAPPEKVNQLQEHLQRWAGAELNEEISSLKKMISRFLQTTSSDENSLSKTWGKLISQNAPLSYHLPLLRWHGKDNVYHAWLSGLLQGDLGTSTVDYKPVYQKIGSALHVSVGLGLLGLLPALLASYLLGFAFTLHPTSVYTSVLRHFLYFLDSVPGFMITLVVFGIYFLAGGSLLVPFSSGEPDLLQTMGTPPVLLGGLCIAFFIIPHLTLQFYHSLQTQSRSLYTRTAMAKGLSYRRSLRVHALPNALVPILTLLSEVVIGLVSGVLIVEITFSLQGIGSLLVKSILSNDYPVVVGITLFLLVFRLAVTTFTDFLYLVLDPRNQSNT